MYVCAVEVACRITHHSVVRKPSVGSALEAISHILSPRSVTAGSQFENDAAITTRAARTGGAVHGSSLGKNDVADGTASVSSALEAVEHTFFPCSVGLGSELVYGTKII